MLKTLKSTFVLSLLFVCCSSFGLNQNNTTANQYTILLPVNVLRPRNINLQVIVPRGFSPLREIGSPTNEFRKADETGPANWSETIVINTFTGRAISASIFVNAMKDVYLNHQGEIIEELREDRDGYSRHKIIFAYNNPVNGRREVVFMQYFNGPADCSGFQYALPVASFGTLEVAVQKLREFVRTSVKMSLS